MSGFRVGDRVRMGHPDRAKLVWWRDHIATVYQDHGELQVQDRDGCPYYPDDDFELVAPASEPVDYRAKAKEFVTRHYNANFSEDFNGGFDAAIRDLMYEVFALEIEMAPTFSEVQADV